MTDHSSHSDARMNRLSQRAFEDKDGGGYTLFVRVMRLILPVFAIVIVCLLYFRSGSQESAIIPVEEQKIVEDVKDQRISRNELLNPNFESTDREGQPYKITAERAIQGELNKDLIMLDRPVGEMVMQNGAVINMQSDTGAYRQDTERFFLEGNVFLRHDAGYVLKSQEAHIDLKENFAWSDQDVFASGPDVSIDAKGIQANGQSGEVIFQGPVKLLLDKGLEGIQ